MQSCGGAVCKERRRTRTGKTGARRGPSPGPAPWLRPLQLNVIPLTICADGEGATRTHPRLLPLARSSLKTHLRAGHTRTLTPDRPASATQSLAHELRAIRRRCNSSAIFAASRRSHPHRALQTDRASDAERRHCPAPGALCAKQQTGRRSAPIQVALHPLPRLRISKGRHEQSGLSVYSRLAGHDAACHRAAGRGPRPSGRRSYTERPCASTEP